MELRYRFPEEKRRKALLERRLARDRAIEASIETWENEILPDWKTAVRTPRLRKLWWNGMPPQLRSVLWEQAIGNPLALSKGKAALYPLTFLEEGSFTSDTYRICIARAKRSLAAGSFPENILNLIEQDIESTLPSLHIFSPESGPLYDDLKDLLFAWVVACSDEGMGYTMGTSKIAAMFLLNMAPSPAFTSMRNFLERHCMRSFYGGVAAKEDVRMLSGFRFLIILHLILQRLKRIIGESPIQTSRPHAS